MPDVTVNWLAVVVLTALNMALGALWYSALFAKQWMAIMTKDRGAEALAGMGAGEAKAYAFSLVGSFLIVYILARFVGYRQADSFGQGVLTGIMVWVGFVVTTSLGGILFERRPKGLYLINNAYHLVSLALVGAVLAIWR